MNEDTEFPFTSEQVGEAQVVAAHPTENVLCYGTGTGEVECYTWDAPPHAGSETFETWPGWSEQFEPEESGQDDVRAVAYTAGGDHVVCVNASGSLMVIDSREGQQLYLAPQEAGSFHSLACIDASTFATGVFSGLLVFRPTTTHRDVRTFERSMSLMLQVMMKGLSKFGISGAGQAAAGSPGTHSPNSLTTSLVLK